MAKAIGLGGVFIKFQDPKGMRNWYQEILGLTTNDYGVLFEFGGSDTKKAYCQLGTFENNTEYFGSKSQQVMINFRVDDLETLLEVFKTKQVVVLDEIESYSYGKFLHIEDPEGNRIELWEPIDAEFEKSPDSKSTMR